MPSIRGRGQGQDLPPFPAPPAPSDSGPPLLLQQLSLPSFLDLAPNASTPFFSDMFFSKNQKTAPPPPKIHQTLGWIDDDCCISSFGGCFEYKKSSPRFFFLWKFRKQKKTGLLMRFRIRNKSSTLELSCWVPLLTKMYPEPTNPLANLWWENIIVIISAGSILL